MSSRGSVCATAIALWLATAATGCARQPTTFSETNARAHVNMLAGTIGSRPIGSEANARARTYIVDQLTQYGFNVRLQETDAVRADLGLTARVVNIIAIRQGAKPDALALVSHYDTVSEAPGGADDALGVAVCLEAGRILAARARPNYTLMVLITDGEELGLMGAAALVTDSDVSRRVRAFLNVDSIGAGHPVMLFETGPANGWLVRKWADAAVNLRGGSYSTEIYHRLPNDTDFTILKGMGSPGLNFSAVGDSYAYHTARDTAERVSQQAIREAGHQLLSVADALDRIDLGQRTQGEPVFFDVAGRFGVSFGRGAALTLTLAAVLFGALAWIRTLNRVRSMSGVIRLFVTAFWVVISACVVAGALWATAWSVRAVREVYHPWYAHPDRFLLLMILVAVCASWSLFRFAALLPAFLRGANDPSVIWTITLPVWMILSAVTDRLLPAASYLWTLPLLAAGILLSVLPARARGLVTAASTLIFVATAVVWGRETLELFGFLIEEMGRVSMVTRAFIFPALLMTAGIMLVPPAMASLTAVARLAVRPSAVTALLLTATVIAASLTYAAPAYTPDRPLRREVRFLQDDANHRVVWQVGSNEPGLDVEITGGAPTRWLPLLRGTESRAPVLRRINRPFVFEAAAEAIPLPAAISASLRPSPPAVELEVRVIAPPSAQVTFVLPGVTPIRSNLTGIVRDGRWTARYVAPPASGLVFQATIAPADIIRLSDALVIVRVERLPGGAGWQSLPSWLPQDRAVWKAWATFVEPLASHLPQGTTPAAENIIALR